MDFWATERRGAVEVAPYSNPPHNYLGQPVIDELGQLVTDWQDPDIRAVVIQSKPQGTAGFAQYSVEELYGMTSDPALSRYAGAVVRGYKAIFDRIMASPKVIIAAMNGDAMGGSFELTLACDLRIGQRGDFRYGNPEVRVGVVPGAGGTQRISRLVGLARALELVLRGGLGAPPPPGHVDIPEETAVPPPMSEANAKCALYLGADSNLQAAYEIENMNWT